MSLHRPWVQFESKKSQKTMLKWAYKKQLEDRKHKSSYPGRQYFQSRRGKISERIKEEFLCDACSKHGI